MKKAYFCTAEELEQRGKDNLHLENKKSAAYMRA